MYLARGSELRAWGRSAPFSTAGPDSGLRLFVGRSGGLSTFPGRFDAPADDLRVAWAPGRGLLGLGSDGRLWLLNAFTLAVESGQRLDEAPDLSDGLFVGAPDGSALRVTWSQAWGAWRYDPSADAWEALELADPGPLRPGAAALVDRQANRLVIFGGGDRLDALGVALVPGEGGALDTAIVEGLDLDAPRPGARALWIADAEGRLSGALLVGGDPDGNLVWLSATNAALGGADDWHGAACTQWRSSRAQQVVCLGGLRDGAPTADAFVLDPATSPPTLTMFPDTLPIAIAEPIAFADDPEATSAIYAQGAGRLFRVALDELSQLEVDDVGPALRDVGGDFARLPTDATVLAGGRDTDGRAIDRLQFFTPPLPGD